jgi:hypothetical protein
MAAIDDSENLSDHLSERINSNGWRVISNSTCPPDPEADELKSLIQTMRQQRIPGKRKLEETEPPEAA